MTCKINGALLFDRNLMDAMHTVLSSGDILLPADDAFKVSIMANELGNAFQKLDEGRQAIVEKMAIKSSKGRFKKDGEGNLMFEDNKKVEEAVVAHISQEVELNCDLLENNFYKNALMKPDMSMTLALLNPIMKKGE